MNEPEYTRKVMTKLKAKGAVPFALVGGTYQKSGLTDRIFVYRGHTYWPEFKGVKTKIEPHQADLHRKLLRAGARICIIRQVSADDAKSAIIERIGLGTQLIVSVDELLSTLEMLPWVAHWLCTYLNWPFDTSYNTYMNLEAKFHHFKAVRSLVIEERHRLFKGTDNG